MKIFFLKKMDLKVFSTNWLKKKKQNFYFHKYRENQFNQITIFISKFLNRFIRTKLNTLSSTIIETLKSIIFGDID